VELKKLESYIKKRLSDSENTKKEFGYITEYQLGINTACLKILEILEITNKNK